MKIDSSTQPGRKWCGDQSTGTLSTGIRAPFFSIALALQLAVLATIPLVLVVRSRWRKLLVPQYYYYLNIGLVAGMWKYLMGDRAGWAKTPRSESEAGEDAG